MENRCIFCNDIIPEGRQFCPNCEKSILNKCPCQSCMDRQIGCHSNCKKYKFWSNKKIAKNKIIREQNEIDNKLRSTIIERRLKNRRERYRSK